MSMFQYSKTRQSKKLGFSARELGRLSEYFSKLILGVNLSGGLDNYKETISDILMLVYNMELEGEEQTVRSDFKLAMTSELRVMNSNVMNNSKKYYL